MAANNARWKRNKNDIKHVPSSKLDVFDAGIVSEYALLRCVS